MKFNFILIAAAILIFNSACDNWKVIETGIAVGDVVEP